MSLARQGPNARQERGENLLAVRLPDRPETQSGGDEIGGLGEDESLEAGAERQTVPARRRGDGDRIGDAAVRRPVEPPQGSQSQAARAAATNAAPCAVVSRRRSAEAVEGDRERVDLDKRRPIGRRGGAKRGREQDGVRARRAEFQKIDEPASSEDASTMSPASTAHSSPCE